MKLTIALQNEMKAEIDKNGNIVIDIPEACKRDLWEAQLEYWLEKDFPTYKDAKVDGGFFFFFLNKIKFVRNNY